MLRFPRRYPEEGRVHAIDFAPLLPEGVTLEDGSGTSWAIEEYSNEGASDSDPSASLVDEPTISGTKVLILVRDGVAGVTYLHTVSVATSDGETLVEKATAKVTDL